MEEQRNWNVGNDLFIPLVGLIFIESWEEAYDNI